MASSVVSSVAQWIGSVLIQEGSLLLGVEDQVQDLRQEMELMQLYLRDADTKQGVRDIRALICNIRKLAYDAEDAIDSYIIEVEAKGQRSNKFVRFACHLHSAPHMYEVAKKIQAIQASMRQITDKLNAYGVCRLPEVWDHIRLPRDERYMRQKPRSYSYDDDDHSDYVVGLKDEIPKLLDVLLGEGKSQVIKFLFIVGMGGSGKTTLARKLFNHPYTNECFDCKAWVYISQEWSTHQALLEILAKVGGSEERTKLQDGSNIGELVDNLRNILEKKSYLVVLDDVWRREALLEILPALPRGSINKGSKIIITTRNRETIQFQTHQLDIQIHEPPPLTEEEGWELFSKIVLNHRENYDLQSFESLGKEMLEKCDGLPLAIAALAGILNSKRSIVEWHQVSEAVRSRIMEGTWRHKYGRVEDLLALSYDDLPFDLKPCFLYLGVFPEDYHIPVGMLIRMWIAEGLVSANDEMSSEDVAMELVEELSNRFMIQVVLTNFKGVVKTVRLHDLLRDICVQKGKEQSFLEVHTHSHDSPNSDVSIQAIQPRRVALHSSTSLPTQASHLRSLILLEQSSSSHTSSIPKSAIDVTALHQNFLLLRLLKLQGIQTVDGTFPGELGGLVHLRYLEVRATNVTKLPISLGNLRNLLTLDYRDIDLDSSNAPVIVKIPNVLCKLVLLRHLFLPTEYPWAVKDFSLSMLKNLRTLWGIQPAGDRSRWFSREISELSTTLKKLKIVVANEDLQAAFSCPSLLSDGLNTLHCELRDGLALLDVEPLYRRRHLYKLVLIGEIKMKLSLFLPINLVMLKLVDSVIDEVNPMEVIGRLSHLKFLSLTNFFKGTTLVCGSGSFPLLEELYLSNLQHLLVWTVEKGSIPCLKKLDIFGCRQLQDFPKGLTFITTLQQLEFFDMSPSFNEGAIKCGWSQKTLRLPHNCEAIIRHSIRKLCESLTAGIFLDNRKKKYWLTKHLDSYYNCFMVCASDLHLCIRTLNGYNAVTRQMEYSYSNIEVEDGPFVVCSEVTESENGSAITVAKLISTFCEVNGKFNVENLSLNITYEIVWVVNFEEPSKERLSAASLFRDAEAGVSSRVKLPDGSPWSSEFIELDHVKPSHEWIQVKVGEFNTSQQMTGELQFSLQYHDDVNGHYLVIKGLMIKPKL